jgi:4-carboxymuconolactone decarboxylase
MALLSLRMIYGQNPLPADIDKESLARLPLLQRSDMDDKGKRIYDSLAGPNSNGRPLSGPLGFAIYNPALAEALHLLHDSVIKEGTLGAHVNELAILIATRETNFSSEWNSHEAAALKAGVDPATIDVVRFNKEASGVPEKDALVIRFGRQLFREKKVSPETFAKAEALFGKRGTVELVAVMGDYALVGLISDAMDQHLPEGKASLPVVH